jgi:hypothetical protein
MRQRTELHPSLDRVLTPSSSSSSAAAASAPPRLAIGRLPIGWWAGLTVSWRPCRRGWAAWFGNLPGQLAGPVVTPGETQQSHRHGAQGYFQGFAARRRPLLCCGPRQLASSALRARHFAPLLALPAQDRFSGHVVGDFVPGLAVGTRKLDRHESSLPRRLFQRVLAPGAVEDAPSRPANPFLTPWEKVGQDGAALSDARVAPPPGASTNLDVVRPPEPPVNRTQAKVIGDFSALLSSVSRGRMSSRGQISLPGAPPVGYHRSWRPLLGDPIPCNVLGRVGPGAEPWPLTGRTSCGLCLFTPRCTR